MKNNNVGQFIVKENTQDKRNPRFVSWITTTNKKPGDSWDYIEYGSWITKHLANFKNLHKLEEYQQIDILQNGQDQFTRYLEQVGVHSK